MLEVTHDASCQRFEVVVDAQRCELDYMLRDAVMTITHTRVPDAVAGRGIAAQLVKAALEFARQGGLRVVPACSYAAAYFRRHPEQRDLLA